jgi:hypothetical protein
MSDRARKLGVTASCAGVSAELGCSEIGFKSANSTRRARGSSNWLCGVCGGVLNGIATANLTKVPRNAQVIVQGTAMGYVRVFRRIWCRQ